MTFAAGFTLENHTISALERHHGFRLDTNSQWDHKHKVDFIVYSIPGFRPRPTGVQITQRVNAFEKMSEFLQAQESGRSIVDRAIYIQVDPGVPLDEGGVDLVALVLRQFQADRQLQSSKVLGAHIYDDITYEFFDLKKAIASHVQHRTNSERPVVGTTDGKQVKAPEAASDVNLDAEALSRALMGDKGSKEMRGILNTYRPSRGFGMATGRDGNSYFVHIYSIVDMDLRDRLSRYSGEAPVNLEIPISFVDGGKTKDHVRYSEAKQVTAMR